MVAQQNVIIAQKCKYCTGDVFVHMNTIIDAINLKNITPDLKRKLFITFYIN